MSWILKDGVAAENEVAEVEYLHDWKTNSHGMPYDEIWLPDQKLAHRFEDRNAAAKMITAVCRMDVQLVRLKPKASSDRQGEEKKENG